MNRWKARLRRTTLGGAILVPVVSSIILLWYANAYILPAEPTVAVHLPNPNGFDTLVNADKLLVHGLDGVYSTPGRKDPNWPLAGRRKLLDANAPALSQMRLAVRQDFLVPPLTSPVKETHYRSGNSFHIREFARLLACAATTHAEEGKLSLAAQDATDAIELGINESRGSGIMDSLVGMSCEAIGEKSLWEIADRLDASTARITVQRLEQIEARRWPFLQTLKEEKRLNHLNTRLMFEGGPIATWKRFGAMFDLGENAANWIMSQMPGFSEPPPSLGQRISAWASFTWTKTRIVFDGPRAPLENMDRSLEALMARSEQSWSSPRPPLPHPGDAVSQLLFPIFAQAEFRVVQNRAHRALMITYLALRAYRLEQGSYPESLDALTAKGYLKSLPVDPFSPTRSPLGYRRDTAYHMTLWSVGPDAKDDAGHPIDGNPRRGSVTEESTGDIVARVNND